MPSAPAIRLELKPSRWQRALVTALLLAASISLLAAPWPGWLRLPALMLLAGLAGWQLRRRRRDGLPGMIIWHEDGRWSLIWPDRPRPVPARLHHARAVGPLVALELRELPSAAAGSRAGRLLAVSLWPDSAEADQLRRLRIRLQRENKPAGAAAGG